MKRCTPMSLRARKRAKGFKYSAFKLSRPQHRPAWSARGVDMGSIEDNAAAAERLGVDWPIIR